MKTTREKKISAEILILLRRVKSLRRKRARILHLKRLTLHKARAEKAMETLRAITDVIEKKSIREIADSLNISEERVRQIYNNEKRAMSLRTKTHGPINLNSTLRDLNLPARLHNALNNANLLTVRDIVSTPRDNFTKYRNMGKASLSDLDQILKSVGFKIGQLNGCCGNY